MSTYETHVMPDPALPFVFHYGHEVRPMGLVGGQNWHENIEVIHVTRGTGIVTLDGERCEAKSGDTVVINANVLHGFLPNGEPFVYDCLIIDRAFCLANHADTDRLRFERCFVDEELSMFLSELAEEYLNPAQGEFHILRMRSLVLSAVTRLCIFHSTPAESVSADARLLSCIKRAIGLVRSESHRDLSLDEVSSFVGLSKFYFAREFKRITRYTFVDYVNLVRCEKARKLLAEGKLSVGEVGAACGFSNRSYFSRIFERFVGVLPSAYQRSCEAKQ